MIEIRQLQKDYQDFHLDLLVAGGRWHDHRISREKWRRKKYDI